MKLSKIIFILFFLLVLSSSFASAQSPGGPCNDNSDCISTQYCNTQTGFCNYCDTCQVGQTQCILSDQGYTSAQSAEMSSEMCSPIRQGCNIWTQRLNSNGDPVYCYCSSNQMCNPPSAPYPRSCTSTSTTFGNCVLTSPSEVDPYEEPLEELNPVPQSPPSPTPNGGGDEITPTSTTYSSRDTIGGPCTNPTDTVLNLATLRGGQAELYDEGNYNKGICFDYQGLETAEQVHQCSSFFRALLGPPRNLVLKLSSTTNAHAAAPEQSSANYPIDLCYRGYTGCQTHSLNQGCQSPYVAVVELSDTTNAHVAAPGLNYFNRNTAQVVCCLPVDGTPPEQSGGPCGGNGGCVSGCCINGACAATDEACQTIQPIPDTDGDELTNDIDPDVDGDGINNPSDPDTDGDGIPDNDDEDRDGDGIPNDEDPTPDGIGTPTDSDGDGLANNDPAETDIDGDGILDSEDRDVDGDGILNNQDSDIDGDGLTNNDPAETDIDGDGILDVDDSDIDGDGVFNSDDPDVDGDGINNVFDSDIDGDGIPNSTDSDDDNDRIPDGQDQTPTGIGTLTDIDGDGLANTDPTETDIDGDGINNIYDSDIDGDGTPNQNDPDADGDGIPNGQDTTPNGAGSEDDVDGDGTPNGEDDDVDGDGLDNDDPREIDIDGDGVLDENDTDVDGDGTPNQNDPDADGDGILNEDDSDVDGDGLPNSTDPDVDGDGINNIYDSDVDGDGLPNSTDPDVDGDGLLNGEDDDVDGDNLLNSEDPDIDGDSINNLYDLDTDGDGLPNSTDPDDDNDSIADEDDTSPTGIGTPNDIDGDGLSNTSDPDTDGDGYLNQEDSDDDNDGILDPQDLTPQGDPFSGEPQEILCNDTSDCISTGQICSEGGVCDDPTPFANACTSPEQCLSNECVSGFCIPVVNCPFLEEVDADEDGVFPCDLCPDEGGYVGSNGCTIGTPSTRGGGGRGTTCYGLEGISCAGTCNGAMTSGSLGASLDIMETSCCLGINEQPPSCTLDEYIPALGGSVSVTRGRCEDPDADGQGTKLITIDGQGITEQAINQAGGISAVLTDCATTSCTFVPDQTLLTWQVPCTTINPLTEREAVPFYNYAAIFITLLVLLGFYFFKRKQKFK